jgi:N utilization substance protein A
MEVIVEQTAVARHRQEGQNVRLAASSPAGASTSKRRRKRREVEAQFEGLETAPESSGAASPETSAGGRGRRTCRFLLLRASGKTVRKLAGAGYASIEAVAAASVEQLSDIPGIGEKTAEKILSAAKGEPAEAAPQEITAAE